MKTKPIQNKRELSAGFSLIEMMIVVVMIGILATMAYPRLERYLTSSRQNEAKTNLMAIYTAQKVYHASNRGYASDIQQLGVETPSEGEVLYTYSLTVDATTFTATAKGNIDDDETLDVWTVDQNKELINVTNDVLD